MKMKYFNELEIRNTGGSATLFLTDPFKVMGLKIGDKISVKVEDDKMIIEKAEKK